MAVRTSFRIIEPMERERGVGNQKSQDDNERCMTDAMTEGGLLRGNRRTLKLALTTGTVCVAASLTFIAADPQASRYEITVYDSYPLWFWMLLFAAVLLGQIGIFESRNEAGLHRYWKWGFGLIIAANTVLLTIPALRYEMYARGDMLTLIGMIREIDALGIVSQTNYYPNVHLYALTFSYATGIDIPTTVNVITPIVTVLYILAVHVLLKALFTYEDKLLFVLPFVSLLLFKGQHVVFQPSWFAFLMVPFVLYLLFRSYDRPSKYRFKIGLLLAVVSLTFYHPAVTLFFIGTLLMLKVAFAVGRRFAGERRTTGNTPVITASIASILFFSWYFSFDAIIRIILSIGYVLLGVSDEGSMFESLAGVTARTNPGLFDVALVGIYKYGIYAAVVGVTLVFLGYRASHWLQRRGEYDAIEAFLGMVFLSFTAIAAVAFVVNITLRFNRFLRFALFAGPILIGIGFYTLQQRLDTRRIVRYYRPIIYTSFFVFAFLSVFTLYGSPVSTDENRQITQAEVEGMDWLFTRRNTSLLIDELGINQFRLYSFTRSETAPQSNIRWRVPPPSMHFEYDNVSEEDVLYGAALERRYLVITMLGREKNPRFYLQYREHWRHSPADFGRLERRQSVSRVYDGGTMTTYVVRGIGNETNES